MAAAAQTCVGGGETDAGDALLSADFNLMTGGFPAADNGTVIKLLPFAAAMVTGRKVRQS